MNSVKEYLGEALGTLLLVFIGCGSVSLAVIFGVLGSLWEVAIVFGAGVTIAILTVMRFCPAHLNPAVSIAMYLSGALSLRKLPMYILSQLTGAFLGGMLLYLIINPNITRFESDNDIIRGDANSYHSAQIFGEYFPNPGYENELTVNVFEAFFVEALGTFLLISVIFILSKVKALTVFNPYLIGLTVTLLICLLAPYTQGGFNPVRDFGPRMVAYISGWGEAALPTVSYSFITVYIAGPITGGILASLIQKWR